jgi:sirohydrochlorin ferrochelatase
MNALLLVAHGSRRKESNSEVAVLAKHMNNLLDGEFDFVEHGFLELAKPYIPDAIDLCVRKGAEKIVVVPYFLSAGRHVAEDVPEEVDKGRANNPNIEIEIADYLGSRKEIADLLVKSAVYVQSGRNDESKRL